MATDALDPGPDGDFPHLPRNSDGTLDTTRMPLKPYYVRVDRELVLIDPRATIADGRRVDQLIPVRDEDRP